MTDAVQQILDEIAPQIFQQVDANLRTQNNSLLGLCFRVSYSDMVGNTHHCPRNGVTNWGQMNDKPKGYPGFSGRVWVRYASPIAQFGSSVFRDVCCHTGTGGGGGYNGPWQQLIDQFHASGLRDHDGAQSLAPVCFSWDVKIFTDDWGTNFADRIETQRMLCKLKNQKMGVSAKWFREFPLESDSQISHAHRKRVHTG